MTIFEIEGGFIELYKLLKAEGLCESGAAAKAAVKSGSVLVDGKAETRKGRKLFPGAVVEFAGEKIEIRNKD